MAFESPVPSVAEPALPEGEFAWHKLVDLDELSEGRVMTVTVGTRAFASPTPPTAVSAVWETPARTRAARWGRGR